VLIKYTSGKRIYLGKRDSRSTRIYFVAALKSNPRISDEIRKLVGISSTLCLRERYIEKRPKRNSSKAEYKEGEKYLQRCKMRKVVTNKAIQKNSKEPSRHKLEKLLPKEDCKSPKKPVKRKPSKPKKYTNCDKPHGGRYEEPIYKKKGRGKKTVDEQDNDAVAAMFGIRK